ncbi:MAG: response regulator transcription factor [Chloroflexi bacterium]|nr:response regulator transcription factor [Chloroflexota bacterium]
MDNSVLVLIVAHPGPMRDGLRALLTAIPQVTSLKEIDDASSALRVVEERYPTLILISVNSTDDDIWNLLAQIKVKHPQTRSILLVNDVQQQQLAQVASVDGVLLKGTPASKLSATIKNLLHV